MRKEEKEIWRPMHYRKSSKNIIEVSSKYLISNHGRVKSLQADLICSYLYGERVPFYANNGKHKSACIEALMYNTFLNRNDMYESNIGVINKSVPISIHNLMLKGNIKSRKQYTKDGEDLLIVQYNDNNQIERVWTNIGEIMIYYSVGSRRNLRDIICNNKKFLNSYWKYTTRSAVFTEFGEVLNF